MKLYIGNLSYTTTEDTLREAFSNYGDVVSVYITKDKFTEQSKGFGFVEMGTDQQSERAIGGMNGKDIDGRRIRVSVAVDKPRREGGAKKFFKDGEERSPRRFHDDGERSFRGERRERGDRFGRGERRERSDRFDRGERFGDRERKPFRGGRPSSQHHEERSSSAEEY